MQLCLGTADSHLQLLGDFLVFPAFDIVQHQYRTRPGNIEGRYCHPSSPP